MTDASKQGGGGGQSPASKSASSSTAITDTFTAASFLTSTRQLLYDLATPLPDEHIRKPGQCS